MDLRSLYDFYLIGRRIDRRARVWLKVYREYLNGSRDTPALPPVFQIIPTERCNLRCRMCNQWGDHGYFTAGHRPTSAMPIDDLLHLLERFGSYEEIRFDYLLSLHGGEPFMYQETDRLLEYLHRRRIDTFISTNGTLLDQYAQSLARMNRHTFYLLSIDGGRATNDRVRGKGTTDKILAGVRRLREECSRQGTGEPKFMLNYCLTEHNPDDIDAIDAMADAVGAVFINYHLRWFLPEEKGKEYNRILEQQFGVKPTNAWTGWTPPGTFGNVDRALERIYQKRRRHCLIPRIPFISMLPAFLSLAQAKSFYHDYDETFGIHKCIMPSYWARIHSNGDLIYCPGHPDIIPGNAFKEDFRELFRNQTSCRLRRYVEKRLLPVCNRCCGLYMTHRATKLLGDGYYPAHK